MTRDFARELAVFDLSDVDAFDLRRIFLLTKWQSEKNRLCSLAVRHATRINNPRVVWIRLPWRDATGSDGSRVSY